MHKRLVTNSMKGYTMTDQNTALEIMATGGFDVHSPATDSKYINGAGNGLNPETLLLIKERHEEYMANPCNGCIHEHDQDPYVLDFCHFQCKEESVQPILLEREVY
jgi:hypothetical protein